MNVHNRMFPIARRLAGRVERRGFWARLFNSLTGRRDLEMFRLGFRAAQVEQLRLMTE
jgi:hypothetical protein